MKFIWRGETLGDSRTINRSHVVVFVHGSTDSDAGWKANPPRSAFGERLLLDFGVEPIYLRYNSGLKVGENGEALMGLMNGLIKTNPAIRKISFVAHSMGGLVVHSAIYQGNLRRESWVKKVKQVFLLGTPHRGAPLAKFVQKSEQVLQFIPNPFALIAASVLNLRSGGLKDMTHGSAALPEKEKILLPKVKYVFVAGTLQKKAGGLLSRLIGDGMVRVPSAHVGQTQEPNWLKKACPWLNRSGDIRLETVPGIGHLGLRNAPAVYEVIARNFKS
jgi:pimeloyl-ACP methyl ester carboxylesterase